MNPLTAIPVAVRRWLYVAYALAALVLAVLPIWGVDVDEVAQTLLVVGTAFGFTAASNATDRRDLTVAAPADAQVDVDVTPGDNLHG